MAQADVTLSHVLKARVSVCEIIGKCKLWEGMNIMASEAMNIISSRPSNKGAHGCRFRSPGRLLFTALHVLCIHACRVYVCGTSLTCPLSMALSSLYSPSRTGSGYSRTGSGIGSGSVPVWEGPPYVRTGSGTFQNWFWRSAPLGGRPSTPEPVLVLPEHVPEPVLEAKRNQCRFGEP